MMVIEKTANLLSKAKIIYGFMFAFAYGTYSVVIYAADQRYMQIANYELVQVKREIRALNREIVKLDTQLIYEDDARKKAMLQALIIQLKNDIKDLKGE